MKTILVLEGGGMRGLYTVGVLDVLMEKQIKIDSIIGVSAGALFGVNYLSKQPGRAIRYNMKYVCDKKYMGVYSLLTTGNIMNKDFCFNKLVYDLDPFDFETFKKSETEFYVTVTNVETGEAEYIKIKDLEKDMEYLRASGSMPLVSKIVEVNNKKYLDGGIADSIPIEKAKQLGNAKIIVVQTRPIDYRKKQNNMLLYKVIYRKYPNLLKTIQNRYLIYNQTIENIIKYEQNGEIFVIRPSKKINIDRIEKNIDKIKEMYELGKNDTGAKINDLIKFIDK